MSKNGTQGRIRKHIHARLKGSLALYFVISIVLIGVMVFHVIEDQVNPIFPFISLIAGVGIGIVVSRVYRISWDHGAAQVISRFDEIGIVILALYILFEVLRDRIVEQFVHGPDVVATSSALIAGIMIGRVVGIGGKIIRVLREQNIS
jgi:hypothetical protein